MARKREREKETIDVSWLLLRSMKDSLKVKYSVRAG